MTKLQGRPVSPAWDLRLKIPPAPAAVSAAPGFRASRLVMVAVVSLLAHVGLFAALATVRVVSRPVVSEAVPMVGTVRILTEDDMSAQDSPAEAGIISETRPAAQPQLIAMQARPPLIPADLPRPAGSEPPVIAVDVQLAPRGVAFAVWSGATEEAEPAAPAGGQASAPATGGGRAGQRAGVSRLHTPRPEYPSAARESGAEGVTVLRLEVRADGSVGEIVVVASSGWESLDLAAVAGVRRWKFVPLRVSGQPVDAWVEQAINFRLNRG